MKCPECESTHIRKNGKRRGKRKTYMTRVEGGEYTAMVLPCSLTSQDLVLFQV
jgi:hypothetical protein